MTHLSLSINVPCYPERTTYIREQLFGMATKLMSSDVTIKAYYDSITLEAKYDHEGAWTQYPCHNRTLYDVPEDDKAIVLQALKDLRRKNVDDWGGFLSVDVIASGVYDINFGFTSIYHCINNMTMEYAETYTEFGCPHLSKKEYNAIWSEDEDEAGNIE